MLKNLLVMAAERLNVTLFAIAQIIMKILLNLEIWIDDCMDIMHIISRLIREYIENCPTYPVSATASRFLIKDFSNICY
jgi:hypothetical protein